MSSSTGSGFTAHITSILCWSFLPSLFTNLVLSTFYRLSPSSQPTIPSNASPPEVATANSIAQRHFRRARIFLVVSYLGYSVLSVYWAQSSGFAQNYYSLLGISREVVETQGSSAIKSHWRKLARIYHPDKVGKDGEARFVELRRGVDVLEHEGRRWAYERFGPTILDWGKLVTNREFLVKGATNAAVFWIFALLSIATFSFFRKDERRNNFWRYLSLFLSASLEFHLLLLPFPSPTFSFFFPNRLTYEHISLLRQLFVSLSMAMSQLTPLLFPLPILDHASTSQESEEQQALVKAIEDANKLKPLLSRLAQLIAAAQVEATALQHLELRPLLIEFNSTPTTTTTSTSRVEEKNRIVNEVKRQMVKTFEDLQIKSNPVSSKVWEGAVRAGRARGSRVRDDTVGGGGKENPKADEDEEEEENEKEVVDESVVVDKLEIPSAITATLESISLAKVATLDLNEKTDTNEDGPNDRWTKEEGHSKSTIEETARTEEEEMNKLKPPSNRSLDHRLPTPPPDLPSESLVDEIVVSL